MCAGTSNHCGLFLAVEYSERPVVACPPSVTIGASSSRQSYQHSLVKEQFIASAEFDKQITTKLSRDDGKELADSIQASQCAVAQHHTHARTHDARTHVRTHAYTYAISTKNNQGMHLTSGPSWTCNLTSDRRKSASHVYSHRQLCRQAGSQLHRITWRLESRHT